ncbi:MAG TPA: DUF3347 domain-containing protein [Flavisolibacter sp.]|nr:DUF3347 domain-containing protein [Flavisolibacter sp.]
MKTIFSASFMAVSILFTACGDNSSKTKDTVTSKKDADTTSVAVNSAPSGSITTKAIIADYIKLKNALANDNGKEAADASKDIKSSLEQMDITPFTPEQKKTYDDVKDDLSEHAEHIASNSNNIAHQREHFDMMSQDMIDLVKSAGSAQTLYKDYCPMFNNNKGASWLSETKEIKNPYLGKKMPTCGEVKEEIKAKE